MILHNYYYYFKKALSHKFCDDIIQHGLNKNQEKGKIGSEKKILEKYKNKEKAEKNLLKIRNSNVIWMNDEWIYNAINPFIQEANKEAGWNFDVDWMEDCQFTIYNKTQHYSWHTDQFANPMQSTDPNFNGKIRKLSAIVSLSNPEEYKGGTLEFQYRNELKVKSYPCKEIKEKGSIIVFPSFVWHRVTPVTSGKRHSLVSWTIGKPFI